MYDLLVVGYFFVCFVIIFSWGITNFRYTQEKADIHNSKNENVKNIITPEMVAKKRKVGKIFLSVSVFVFIMMILQIIQISL